MQDVAFRKLARGGVEDVRAGDRRHRVTQSHHVLQLVAEPECAARLVEARPTPDAAREGLVEQPSREEQVEGLVGRADRDRAEDVVPEPHTRRTRRLRGGGNTELAGQRERVLAVVALPQDEVQRRRRARRQIHVDLQRPAHVAPGLDDAGEPHAHERSRCAQVAERAEELPTVGRQPMRTTVRSEERHALRELVAPGIADEKRLACAVVLGHEARLRRVAGGAEDPLHVARDGDATRSSVQFGQRQAQQLDRRLGVHVELESLVETVAPVPELGGPGAGPNLSRAAPRRR